MSKHFISTLPDGRLAITTLSANDPAGTHLAKTMFELSRTTDRTTHFDPTVHTLAAIAAGLPGHTPLLCRECDESALPAEQADRGLKPTFRDAWEDTGAAVQINMPKARVIHMNRIRATRDVELAKLDVPFMRAVEDSDVVEQVRITNLKRTLRDIPQTFDLSAYATPEELKAAWPAALPPQSYA